MTERPIIFSGPMVRAILDGRKTQTRRLIQPVQPRADGRWPAGRDPVPDCPHGKRGDRLWVRETWRPVMEAWCSYVEYKAGGPSLDVSRDDVGTVSKIALRFPGAKKERKSEAWHSSIHMPRWASRLAREIVSVRVDQLQAISEEDAVAELGLEEIGLGVWTGLPGDMPDTRDPVAAFSREWDKNNGKRAPWEENPWVWVVSFTKVAGSP